MINTTTGDSRVLPEPPPPVTYDFDDDGSACPSCGNRMYGGYCEDCDELHLGW